MCWLVLLPLQIPLKEPISVHWHITNALEVILATFASSIHDILREDWI
jgi:hypothetical protein